MTTQQDTLLFIGELILAQKLDDTKWTEQRCKKAMFQVEPSASEAERRSSVRVFDAFPIKDLIAIALEE